MEQQRLEAPFLWSDGRKNSSRRRWGRDLCFLLALIALTLAGLALTGHLDYRVVRGEIQYTNERIKLGNNGEVVESEKAVVAADDARCSQIGASILRQGGGHAVDAAVATALCLGVVNPMASGIGGGGFMLVRSSKTSQTQAFDMRETAPLASSQNMYANNPDTKSVGALSLGVPGEIAGLYEAWLKHGRLPWKSLFQPAIKLARDGFVIARYLGNAIDEHSDSISSDPGLRQVYAPDGILLKTGDICYNVELGHSLEAIAEQGPQAFYDGAVGEKFVKDVRQAGGILTMGDLRSYRVDVTEAVAVNTMGYTILGMPPPSSGTLGISLVLKVLDSYGSSSDAKGNLGLFPRTWEFNFFGNLDLIRFIKTIQEEGLYFVLWPYVCAEWNYGGFPVWLHNIPGVEFRTANNVFMAIATVTALEKKYGAEITVVVIDEKQKETLSEHETQLSSIH